MNAHTTITIEYHGLELRCPAANLREDRGLTDADIARIRAAKGDVDAALKLHHERIAIFEVLGDLDGIANTFWSIAQIELQRRQLQEAFEHLAKSYEINLKLGRLDGICFVGLDLSQLLCAAGQRDEGVKILIRSRDGFQKLGRADMARHAEVLLEQCSQASS